jgi:hypothetical protein
MPRRPATVKAAKACKTDAALKGKIADKTYKNFGACVKAQTKLASLARSSRRRLAG